ncbi:MAG TPA: ribosome-associated translation inhibitor RaiA, partial [Ruminococcaceae bacterium]|nr:ribosome-associated translation inhibitor RaiA [Oscillospiraceae bacterium]
MNVTITGRKVNLRDNFKELAVKKLSRFDRIFSENALAKVVVTLEKNRQTVEITITSEGMIYRAEATDYEMNDALDKVVSALGKQIRRNKAKLNKKVHSSVLEEYIEENPSDNDNDAGEFKIVRTKHFPVKPMSTSEAVLQMELLNHQFFMFRNQ